MTPVGVVVTTRGRERVKRAKSTLYKKCTVKYFAQMTSKSQFLISMSYPDDQLSFDMQHAHVLGRKMQKFLEVTTCL